MVKIAIIGFGLGGIFAMLEALKAGHSVEIFEKRAKFKRTNVILFWMEIKPLLNYYHEEFVAWATKKPEYQDILDINQKIYSNGWNQDSAIEIGQLQIYFLNLLPMLKELYPGKLQVHGPLPNADDSLLLDTVLPNGTIIIKDPSTLKQDTLKVDHIICAEGANRRIAKALGFRFEKTDVPLYRFWAKYLTQNNYTGLYSPKELKTKASEFGFNKNLTPNIESHLEYVAIQIPAWIMFLPSQQQRSIATKRYIAHTTFNYLQNLKSGEKIPLQSEIELERESLFIVEHSQPVKQEVFRQISPGTQAHLIGDARELSYFVKSYGANHAIQAAQECIQYITSKNNGVYRFNTLILHKENLMLFGLGIQESATIDTCLISEEYKEKWASLIGNIALEPFKLEIIGNDTLSIDCTLAYFKSKLALFIRFILKTHANGFREDFFQSLLHLEGTDNCIKIKHASEMIELLNLHVNLQQHREGFEEVGLNEFEKILESLKKQFLNFLEIKKPFLYPEMTAEALFEYLKQTQQLELIQIISKDDSTKPNLMGLTKFQNENDLCSLYEVIDHHFDDTTFFRRLRALKSEEQSFAQINCSFFKNVIKDASAKNDLPTLNT